MRRSLSSALRWKKTPELRDLCAEYLSRYPDVGIEEVLHDRRINREGRELDNQERTRFERLYFLGLSRLQAIDFKRKERISQEIAERLQLAREAAQAGDDPTTILPRSPWPIPAASSVSGRRAHRLEGAERVGGEAPGFGEDLVGQPLVVEPRLVDRLLDRTCRGRGRSRRPGARC